MKMKKTIVITSLYLLLIQAAIPANDESGTFYGAAGEVMKQLLAVIPPGETFGISNIESQAVSDHEKEGIEKSLTEEMTKVYQAREGRIPALVSRSFMVKVLDSLRLKPYREIGPDKMREIFRNTGIDYLVSGRVNEHGILHFEFIPDPGGSGGGIPPFNFSFRFSPQDPDYFKLVNGIKRPPLPMPKGSVHIPGRINDIAYDTSGRILAAATDNGIFLIDAVTRKMTFHLETAKTNAAAYKGEDLVIATDSGLEIYNPEFELVNKVDTGSPVHSLEYGHGFIYVGTEQGLMKFTTDGEVVFSLSGKNIITDILAAGEHILAAAEQEVRVLKQDGSLVKTLPGAGKLAFSGKTLAAAGKDGIALYNPAWNSLTGSGTDKDKEEGKATAVNTVALSPSGLFLIAGADEGLGIWVSSTGYPIHTIKSRPVSLMAMSRTGEFALVVDDEISFMEAVKEPSGNLVVENNSATAINLLINGRKPEAGAVIEKGGSRTYSGMLIGQYELSAAPLTAQRIRLSQASTTIKEDANSKIYVYQESSAVPILSPGQQFEVLSAVRAGDLLALGFEASRPGPNGTVYGTIHVFKGERLHHHLINGHSNKINAMALDEGRERLFSGGADRLVLLWNLKEAHPVPKTVLHSDEVVRSLSLSGDNSKIAVGAGVITIIDTASNRVLKTLPDGSIAAFSPLANTTIITANKEHLRIYSGRNFTLSRSVVHDAGSEPVFIAYSPNGKTILLGFENNTLREYAADTLDLLYSFQGMTAVYAEDFKITGGIDGMLRVYNNTGRLLSAVKAHDGAITAVSSGAGGLITSSSKDGTARTWKLQDQLTEKGIHVYYHRDKEWLHISGGYYAASDADAGAIHLKNPVQSLFNPARVIESTKN